MEKEISKMTIGEIVASDIRKAEVFKEAGIDFCCGGKKTLSQTCSEAGINEKELTQKLNDIKDKPGSVFHRFNEWDPGFLSDYIVNIHHSYVRKSLPELMFYVQKIADVHGANHKELHEVAELFGKINDELSGHLKKEEDVFFPAIKDLFSTGSEEARKIVRRELDALGEEHESAGGAMDRINTITSGYKLPEDACNSYRLTFRMLSEFEDDLHTHVHLENNVLFPKAMQKIA